MANALESQKTEVSLLLLDDSGITALNGQYRGKPRPTDVLSFPLYTAEELGGMQPDVLGDVVISIETAARQAEHAGCSLWEEMSRLLIHGILHLLGFDHENNAAGARAMRARENQILFALLTDKQVGGAIRS